MEVKTILAATLVTIAMFTAGLGIVRYRENTTMSATFLMTEYADDGTVERTSNIVRVFNRRGDWSSVQSWPGKDWTQHSSHGFAAPRVDLGTDAVAEQKEFLGYSAIVLHSRRNEVWYCPSLNLILKDVLYTDETKKTVMVVTEAVEIKN